MGESTNRGILSKRWVIKKRNRIFIWCLLVFVFEKYFKGERMEKMSKQGNGNNFT